MKNLIKKISIGIIGLLVIGSCDKIEKPYQIASEGTSTRKVMIEEFTGHTCGNCPKGSLVLKELTEALGSQIIAISVHAGTFAIASDNGDKYRTEYRTQAGEAVANEFQIDTYPVASVARTLFNGLRKLPSGAWGSKASDLLALDADVTIDISASLDTVTRNLVVDVNTTLINAVEGEFSISVGLVEDSIVDYQKFYVGVLGYTEETDVPDYMHRHVFRGNINGNWGQPIDLAIPLETTVSHSMPVTPINPTYKLKHMSVIAYIHNNETREIIQAEEVHLLH